jgi:hypothetical protein
LADIWSKAKSRNGIISPSGKGRSFYADLLRQENPDKTIIEIDVQSDTEEYINNEPESYSKMNKELTPELLTEACEVLSLSTGVVLSPNQLLALIDEDVQLCFSLVLNGPNDTEVRGDLASALSEKLVGKRWGTYGDKDFKVDQFVKQVQDAALNEGYSLKSGNY